MGPQTRSLLANVTGNSRSQNRYICIFKMVHGSLPKAARVRFQHQLPCSWLCVNESQPAAKIMLHGPKKLMWGLLSTWLTFPVALRHILRDFNWVWSALRDWLFSLIIKMNLLKNVGRINCTSGGSLRVWGPSGDNRHRFQKARWDFDVPYMEVNKQ